MAEEISGQGLPWALAALASVLGGGGVWGWLTERAKLREAQRVAQAAEPADLAKAYASFAKTLNDQAEAFIRALQHEREELVRQVSDLRHEIDRLSREHEQCLGDNRQLQQRVDSLEHMLMTRPNQLVELSAGGATVIPTEPAAE